VGLSNRLIDTFTTLMGSLFVNVVVPSAGMAGAALFLDEAARRGQSRARTAAGILLSMVADFAAVTLFLVVSLIYLESRAELKASEVAGTAALVVLIGTMTLLLLFGRWRPRWLHAVLGAVYSTLARLAHWARRPPLALGWAERTAEEFIAVAKALSARPSRLVRLLAIAAGMHALNGASLAILFLAFHETVRIGPLAAGYALGLLAWILSPVPQGIGVVEGVMTLVFVSLGVPAEKATVISLAFRGLTFWLPMVAGFLLFRRLGLLRVEPR
jgi:hypothetical protein